MPYCLDIHTSRFTAGYRALHCWNDVRTPLYQFTITAEPRKHAVKRNVTKVGSEVLLIAEQSFLLLRDTIQTAIVIDYNNDRQVFLERSFDTQSTGQKSTISADHHYVLVRVL